ncbi:SDR family oxidoreductase [Paenibacillus dauci]|uniref:SDR family oxidoreductase n=1 Tax=Paenibacillus dauci TaxID=1567106 RepID=UPI00061938E1|nr:SDR family oxidoreductase [Paenibacillus dauci]
MSNLNGKVIVITGASSGIGEATARLLAARGAHVVLGARRTERLEVITSEIQAAGGSAAYMQLDVTRLEEMEQFIQFAVHTYGQVDVLLNNAGVMPLSALEEIKVEEWNRMIDVNIRGVLHGIAAGLPLMKQQSNGHFINIASIGAYSVTPTAAVYCATKYAVKAITDGLRMETDSNIRVTLISPGVTESELADTISDEHARQAMKEYRSVSIPASSIANAILYAIEQPAEVDVSEMIIRPAASIH